MKPAIRLAASGAMSCLVVIAAAASVGAQSAPQFRDPKTGVVWTPDNVARENRLEPASQLPTSADKAFDPRSQVVTAGAVTVQRPRANLMGTVPITAGPSVPIVSLDGPSLQALPGDRWLTVLYVINNSGAPVDPQIGCTFTNGGRSVEEARVIVPTTAAGTRLGVPVYGPRTDIFVDRVLCRVLTP